jgi:hypothetical protein
VGVVFPKKSFNDASLAHTGCPKKQQRRHPVARRIAQQLAKANQNLFSSGIIDPAFLPNPAHPLGISQ